MRESYRLDKLSLLEAVKERNLKIRVLFSLTPKAYDNHRDLDFKKLSENMSRLLLIIEDKL